MPNRGEAGWWSTQRDALTVGWPDYAEYRVDLHPVPTAEVSLGPIAESEAATAFLLSVLPLCLPLFDVEPLHGSAVRMPQGAIVLLGPTGAGKSSVASAMETMGFDLLADDCCAIDDQRKLWPGPPLLNPRWHDAQQPIVGTYNLKSIRRPERYSSEPQDVEALLSLERDAGARLEVRPVRASDALTRILANVRSPDVFATRRRDRQLRLAAALSSRRVGVVTYDPARHSFSDVASAVIGWSR